RLAADRIATENTHGTGCTLSSAIAAGLAKGLALSEAVGAAKRYVTDALVAADRIKIGSGHGPAHHFHTWWGGRGARSATILPFRLYPLVPLVADPIDAKRDHVARLEKFRLRLHAEADARRRAREYDVSRLQHEVLRAAPDEMPAVEDHSAG